MFQGGSNGVGPHGAIAQEPPTSRATCCSPVRISGGELLPPEVAWQNSLLGENAFAQRPRIAADIEEPQLELNRSQDASRWEVSH